MSTQKREDEGPGPFAFPDVIEPVVGIRAWKVISSRVTSLRYALSNNVRWETASLASIGVTYRWVPTKPGGDLQARHMRTPHMMPLDHRCPEIHSDCGFWIVRPDLHRAIPHAVREDISRFVVGRVKGWGRVFVYEYGWRCEFARPLSLFMFKNYSIERKQIVGDIARLYGIPVEEIPETHWVWLDRDPADADNKEER